MQQKSGYFFNPLSRVEKKGKKPIYNVWTVNQDIFEPDDVAKSCPVS